MPSEVAKDRLGGDPPWPDDVVSVAVGSEFEREVRLPDESAVTVPVTVTSIIEMRNERGEAKGAHAVTYQYDPDGGSA